MPISMYQSSVPVCVRVLENLATILTKAEAYAASRKIEPQVLLNARLAPDMFALTRQVQIACDITKGGAARLAGIEIPSFEDKESSFAELQERIRKTVAFVQSLKPEQIDGSEERAIHLKVGPNEMHFKGLPYLMTFVLPNVFFHVTTSYAILRHNGLDIGKMDFLGDLKAA